MNPENNTYLLLHYHYYTPLPSFPPSLSPASCPRWSSTHLTTNWLFTSYLTMKMNEFYTLTSLHMHTTYFLLTLSLPPFPYLTLPHLTLAQLTFTRFSLPYLILTWSYLTHPPFPHSFRLFSHHIPPLALPCLSPLKRDSGLRLYLARVWNINIDPNPNPVESSGF